MLLHTLRRNVADLPRAFSFSSFISGLVAVLVGYAGPLLLVFQASDKAGLDRAHLSSWISAVALGCGFCALTLSLYYRKPILVAWPTAGVALLIASIANYAYPEVIGAYILSGIGLVILGWSKLFGRLIELVPKAVIAGMLGGVLLKFGLSIFTSFAVSPLMVGAMMVTYFVLRRLQFKAPAIGALVVGLIIAALHREIHLENFSPQLTTPVITWPQFTLRAAIGLALPLFIITLTSQNAPGTAVLRNSGYPDFKPDGPITLTGIVSVLGAPFGLNGLSLAAITAAICTSPEAHPDADKRYSAGVSYGFWYILFGLFGATAVTLFSGLPKSLTAAIAGLAITGAILNSLAGAMADAKERDGGLVAFLVAASDITLLGVGAPFWGLVAGLLTNLILNGTVRRRKVPGTGDQNR
jgi:benzoate membrane transport protein